MKTKLVRPEDSVRGDDARLNVANEAKRVRTEMANSTRALLIQTGNLNILTAGDMTLADQYLGEVNVAIREVDAKFDPIIAPINQALTLLRRFKREVMTPLEQAKESIRNGMAVYERRRIEIEAEARHAEAERLRAEAFARERDALRAKTAQMRERLAKQREEFEARAAQVEEAPVIITPSMPSSGMAIVKRWRITDTAAFYRGLADGTIPRQVVALVQGEMNAAARNGTMEGWPGCEVYDDVQVRSR